MVVSTQTKLTKQSDEIVRAVIYPGIGIARVGNSTEFFIGPEVMGKTPDCPGGFKDPEGRVKRQAARFRVYGLNAQGEVVRELMQPEVEINWRVELANRKAGWYQFINAMDLPNGMAIMAGRRNANLTGLARGQLDIVPGAREISGTGQHGPAYSFDTGKFFQKRVYLGELRTDSAGRLLVLGGRGLSAPQQSGKQASTFANNDGWHDDVSDGPVRATVKLGNAVLEAEPAYVVVAPPDFAPGLYGPVTMDDVVRDLYFRQGWLPCPKRPSFTRDIWPIFDRLQGNQWVNHGVYMLVGLNSPVSPLDPAVQARLASRAEKDRPFRTALFRLFHNPASEVLEPAKLPPFYGDTYSEFQDSPRVHLSLVASQYRWLEQWAEGDFEDDWTGAPPVPPAFDSLSPALQTEALNRAGLYSCLGGPFHPGIELTWIMRVASMWQEPYRLKLLPEGEQPSQDYGEMLLPEVCLGATGPLQASGPGALTRWTGVPWQTDEASCASGYNPHFYVSLPSFWAARVPNQVLSAQSYEQLQKTDVPLAQRLKSLDYRQDWYRDIAGTGYTERINNMIGEWWEIGIVTPMAGPDDAAGNAALPAVAHVEMGRSEKLTGRGDPTFALLQALEKVGKTDVQPMLAAEAVETVEQVPEQCTPPRRQYGRGDV
ncbi:MAG TPA: LodA/GoxA family CTQ-dependent oxidase [Noviherbaspirillum sp.]